MDYKKLSLDPFGYSLIVFRSKNNDSINHLKSIINYTGPQTVSSDIVAQIKRAYRKSLFGKKPDVRKRDLEGLY